MTLLRKEKTEREKFSWLNHFREGFPVAFVDEKSFKKNIQTAKKFWKQFGKEKTIRIATKSIRVPKLIQFVLDQGKPFQGLLCYSAQEVEKLAALGFDDFLVAYPTLQDSDLLALKRTKKMGKKVRLVVDSREGLLRLHEVFGKEKLPVVFDIDASLRFFHGTVHLGVRRSPLRTAQEVCAFLEEQALWKSALFEGLMCYEAQVAGVQEKTFPLWMQPLLLKIKNLSMKRLFIFRKKLKYFLKKKGFEFNLFNGGGTGSLVSSLKDPALTEVTIGSGFLCGHLFCAYQKKYWEKALFFALQIVRASDEGYFTCQGGGYVSSGAPGWEKLPKLLFPKGYLYVKEEGAGEVQTPFCGKKKQNKNPYAVLSPAKSGELAERFLEYLFVEQGKVKKHMKTYRGMGWCFY